MPELTRTQQQRAATRQKIQCKKARTEHRRTLAKLRKLLEIYGYDNLEEMADAVYFNIRPLGICTNARCSFTTEVDSDQDRGWCNKCSTNSVKSVLVLLGLI